MDIFCLKDDEFYHILYFTNFWSKNIPLVCKLFKNYYLNGIKLLKSNFLKSSSYKILENKWQFIKYKKEFNFIMNYSNISPLLKLFDESNNFNIIYILNKLDHGYNIILPYFVKKK